MKTRIACIAQKKRVLRCHFCNDKRSAGVLFVGITTTTRRALGARERFFHNYPEITRENLRDGKSISMYISPRSL